MDIECPNCKEEHEIDNECLPGRARDDNEYTCIHCAHVFNIGWYAAVEIR